MSRPWRSCHFPLSHKRSREMYLRRHLVIYSVQPFPSNPRYPLLTNHSYPPPYPEENRHSQTRMSPSSLTRCNSPAQPTIAQPTIAALMSIHQRMVQHAPTPHFQTSQPRPNPRSLGSARGRQFTPFPGRMLC